MYLRPGVIPTLNGAPFVEKPPLYYWATALSFRIAGGPDAAAARAVSGLAALLTLALAFVWVARAVSRDAAVVSTVILATSVGFVTSAHWIRIDALLLLFLTLAIWAAWERIGNAGGPWFLVTFYAGVVLALWTKGLVGPVLVVAGLTVYAAVERSVRVLAPLRPIWGALALVSAVASLAVAIAATGGREALSTWFFVNHVERFVHPVATGHQAPLAYYTWMLPAAIAPWLVPFVALFNPRAPVWSRDRPDSGVIRFAAAMTAGPLVILTLSSSKRGVYLLPLLPALSLLLATAVGDRIAVDRRPSGLGRRTVAADWIHAAILGLTGLAPAVLHVVVTRRVSPEALAFGCAGLVAAVALATAVARRKARRAFWIGAFSMGVAIAGLFALVVPRLDDVKNFQPFLAGIDAVLPRGEPVRALGADETLLGIVPFVTGRRVIPIAVGDLAEGTFVLVQSGADEAAPRQLETSYEPIASRNFGPGRRMALWRRR